MRWNSAAEKANPDGMSERARVPRRARLLPLHRSALATALLCLAGASRPAGAISYVKGQSVSDTGKRIAGLVVAPEVQTELISTTTGGGWFLIDRLLPGSNDRVAITAGGIENFLGPTFFVGAYPETLPESLVVETSSLQDWIDLVDDGSIEGDATIDESRGTIFGEVRSALGGPVAGAVVRNEPPLGQLYYFDEEGNPDPAATATPSSGRFVILNVDPTDAVVVTASAGGQDIARAYGKVVADTVSGLGPLPFMAVAGCAVEAAGAGGGGCAPEDVGSVVPGAAIAWDFDPGISAVSDANGDWSLADLPGGGIPAGMGIALRGSAAGYLPALSFSRSRDETSDVASVQVGFVTSAQLNAWQAAFGILQAPSLGAIFGRVRGAEGSGAPGATVTLTPGVGEVRYFDAFGVPDPSLAATSASGLFAVFNVPVGNVTLAAIAPNEVIRSAVAPSRAGTVTSGSLFGARLITLEGRVQDENFRTSKVTGAAVTILEYPYLATVTNGAGVFSFNALDANRIPADEPLTLRIERNGFKICYTFSETFTDDQSCTNPDCSCPDSSSSDYDPLCVAGYQTYLISETGFSNLYLRSRAAPNAARGLVSAGVFFSNGIGTAGLSAGLTPQSGTVRYLKQNGFSKSEISPVGAVQFLNAAPVTSGFVAYDVRNGEATLQPVRVFPNAVSISASFRIDCDPQLPGLVPRNLYPCDGALMTKRTKNVIFQWDLGTFLKGKVQISANPTMANCPPDATESGKCIEGPFKQSSHPYWKANQTTWDAIRKLADPGATVYWRVLLQKKDADNNTVKLPTVPFALTLP
jgi:hypothetical protein